MRTSYVGKCEVEQKEVWDREHVTEIREWSRREGFITRVMMRESEGEKAVHA